MQNLKTHLRDATSRRKLRRSLLPIPEQLEQRIVFNNYWVTNLADDGMGSLRAAIVASNAHAGSDSISFKSNLSGVIALTRELQITGDTEIEANHSRKVTISGQDLTRVLKIESGAKVEISNLIITKGKTTDAAGGGGILNLGNLTLQDSVVTGNTAVQTDATDTEPAFGGFGGGIQNVGKLRVEESEISNNKAFSGGGISNRGTAIVEESKIVGNDALLNGGGLLNTANPGNPTAVSDLTISESLVANNTCTSSGAGIRSDRNMKLKIDESTISGNVAKASTILFATGGIASAGDLTITDSLITRNQGSAGGIFLFGFSPGKVLISRSEISYNTPTPNAGFAGGIGSVGPLDITIEDSLIRNNQGNAGGLSALFNANLKIVRSQIRENKGNVGGLALGSGKLIQSTVSGNMGTVVGGMSAFGGTIDSSTISNNIATPTGYLAAGGILGDAQLVNSTISGNVVDATNMDTTSTHPYPSPLYTPRVAGGLLAPPGNSSLTNTTVAFNSVINAPAKSAAQSAGGVLGFSYTYEPYGTFNADVKTRNTIIAKNTLNAQPDDVAGTFVSGGHNLIGALTADAAGFVASDLKGTATLPLNPRLGPLTYNGGFTKTHLLLGNSPARDAGDSTDATATDQRGYFRIAGSAIDIGAVEFASRRATPQVERHDWVFEFDRWNEDDWHLPKRSNQGSNSQNSDDGRKEKLAQLSSVLEDRVSNRGSSSSSSRHSIHDKLLEDLLYQL